LSSVRGNRCEQANDDRNSERRESIHVHSPDIF
jgi:hypothetical protein